MSTAEVLQSYVIKLGYAVDAASAFKFTKSAAGADKKISEVKQRMAKSDLAIATAKTAKEERMHKKHKSAQLAELRQLQLLNQTSQEVGISLGAVGSAIVAIGSASAIATIKFAEMMRQTYFKAELTGTTVGGLTGMEMASKGLGMSDEAFSEAAKNMYQTSKANLGVKTMIENLTGMSVEGKKAEDVMWAIADAAMALSPIEAVQIAYAENMKLPQEMFLMMKAHPEIRERMKEGKDIISSYTNPEEYEEMMKEYGHQLDIIEAKLKGIKMMALSALSEPFAQGITWVNNFLDAFRKDSPAMKQSTVDNWMERNRAALHDAEEFFTKNLTISDPIANSYGKFISDIQRTDRSNNGDNKGKGVLGSIWEYGSSPSSGSMRLPETFLGSSSSTTNNRNDTTTIVNNITNNISGSGANEIADKVSDRTFDVIQRNFSSPLAPGR